MGYTLEIQALIDKTNADHEALSGDARLWGWFGLSRAAWLTLPRVLMHEMPPEWQGKMASLMEEFDDAFPSWADRQFYVTAKKDGKFTALPEALCNYRRPLTVEIDKMRQVSP